MIKKKIKMTGKEKEGRTLLRSLLRSLLHPLLRSKINPNFAPKRHTCRAKFRLYALLCGTAQDLLRRLLNFRLHSLGEIEQETTPS